MPYVKCTFCGKSGIQALDIDICSTCLKRDDDRIRVLAIKKYLELYPDAKMKDVSEALGIKMEIINRLIDEGSLLISYDEDGRVTNKEEKKESAADRRKRLISELSARSAQDTGTRNNNGNSRLVNDLTKLRGSYGFGNDER